MRDSAGRGRAATCGASGAREVVEPALRRRRSRCARRRPRSSARAPRRRSPRACARAARPAPSSQLGEPVGELRRPRAGRPRRSATGAPRRDAAAASARATSAMPEWPATTGQRAAGGRLGGDHAERLGERARHRHRLRGGQHVGELLVLEPAGPVHAVGSRRGGGAGSAAVARDRARRGTRPARAAPRRPRRAARARRRGRRARARPRAARARSRNAPKPTTSSRASGTRASTSGQAASSSSTPLEAISLPTKTTIRSRRGIERARAPRRPRRVERANEESGAVRRRPSAASSRSRERPQARRGRVRLARREAAHVDAGRAEPGPLLAARARPAPPTGSRPCGASRRARRARPRALARGGQEARVTA